MGWLGVLSEWAGAEGAVTGTDIDERMLAAARSFVESEALTNVVVERDDRDVRGHAEPGIGKGLIDAEREAVVHTDDGRRPG